MTVFILSHVCRSAASWSGSGLWLVGAAALASCAYRLRRRSLRVLVSSAAADMVAPGGLRRETLPLRLVVTDPDRASGGSSRRRPTLLLYLAAPTHLRSTMPRSSCRPSTPRIRRLPCGCTHRRRRSALRVTSTGASVDVQPCSEIDPGVVKIDRAAELKTARHRGQSRRRRSLAGSL